VWGREARSRAIANATAFNESKSTISYFLWNRLLCLDFSMMEKCLRTKELHARFGVTLRESEPAAGDRPLPALMRDLLGAIERSEQSAKVKARLSTDSAKSH
jgi:hypothetical protein